MITTFMLILLKFKILKLIINSKLHAQYFLSDILSSLKNLDIIYKMIIAPYILYILIS